MHDFIFLLGSEVLDYSFHPCLIIFLGYIPKCGTAGEMGPSSLQVKSNSL